MIEVEEGRKKEGEREEGREREGRGKEKGEGGEKGRRGALSSFFIPCVIFQYVFRHKNSETASGYVRF